MKTMRHNKGENLLEGLSNYVALDLETTGYDPGWDEIIEVGAVRIKEGGIVETFQSFIKPENEISEFVTEYTGITNNILSKAPVIVDIFPRFIEFIGSDTVIAHNANHDVNFIYDNCNNLLQFDFKNNFIDTMRISRRIFKEHAHHRLIDLVERFGIGNVAHRALSDAIKAHECYEYMKSYMANKGIDFPSLYPKKTYSQNELKAKNIQANNTEFDETSAIYRKIFVFTGALEKMLRKDAMQIVVDKGGLCGDAVTQKTNYLVLGNNDYRKSLKDGKSSKQKRAEELKLKGLDIEIISENVFYGLFEE